MIGLGSNRLSVCRRGGMSVTQAGKGGMEWLAGIRYPDWATPYSAQATAALKAAFPTQWETIAEYGRQHPEIVGYMNAYAPEDPKIAYSLVEGIGTRWIQGNGAAYITTDIILTRDAVIAESLAAYTHTSNTNNAIFGSYSGSSAYYLVSSWYGKYFIARGGQSQYTMAIQVDAWKLFRIEYLNGYAKAFIDGDVYGSNNQSSFTTLKQYLMARNNSGNADLQTKHKVQYIKFKAADETPNYWFIPFVRTGGAKGMMDIINGVFYPDATGNNGFTISETPAS